MMDDNTDIEKKTKIHLQNKKVQKTKKSPTFQKSFKSVSTYDKICTLVLIWRWETKRTKCYDFGFNTQLLKY